MVKQISILGSTGSIGVQTCDVIREFPSDFTVVALSAGRNLSVLKDQICEFKPALVSVWLEEDAKKLEIFIKEKQLKTEVFFGQDGNCAVATQSKNHLLVVAIVGTTSILPTYKAIQKGIDIGLACKEVLVSAGSLIMNLARQKGVSILPIDSEHAAIKQCLASIGENKSYIDKLHLTASGGPFRELPIEKFSSITLKQALKHPNWSMGHKITIDSATLMNKGLEVIEAHYLFDVPFDHIEVVVHPQSMIHSMVSFSDGNILAQLGPPDMRYPIQYVLTYPEKKGCPWPKLTLSDLQDLQFFKPDTTKFPLLSLAYEMGKKGGSYPVVLNAANEAIVGLFLQEKISFIDIYNMIKYVITTTHHQDDPSLEDIVSIDLDVKNRVNHDNFLKEFHAL